MLLPLDKPEDRAWLYSGVAVVGKVMTAYDKPVLGAGLTVAVVPGTVVLLELTRFQSWEVVFHYE